MLDKDSAEKNLAHDYLDGASGFLLAAERILNSSDQQSEEWLFKLENPVCFLICHAAELILKAGLAVEVDFNEVKFKHDLVLLIEKSRAKNIPLNVDFCGCAWVANENFSRHDHRYQRTFAGFAPGEHDKLMLMLKENPEAAREEMRKHGLVSRHIPNLKSFLKTSTEQLSATAEWINLK